MESTRWAVITFLLGLNLGIFLNSLFFFKPGVQNNLLRSNKVKRFHRGVFEGKRIQLNQGNNTINQVKKRKIEIHTSTGQNDKVALEGSELHKQTACNNQTVLGLQEMTKNPFWKKNDTKSHEQRASLPGSECLAFDSTMSKAGHRYAYYFYAANANYLCGAKVLKAQIIALDGINADFVLSLSRSLMSHAEDLETTGWRILPACDLPGPLGMYAATLHKIRAFHLIQYERVLYMDTDMSIVRSVHHIFDLPHAPLIGAWSYWDNRPTITGPFWVAAPSMKLWYKLWKSFHNRKNENPNDMSVINAVFGHAIPGLCPDPWGNGIRIFPQALMLPYYYMVIDSDFHRAHEPYMNVTEVCHIVRTVHFTVFGKPFSFSSWKSSVASSRQKGDFVHECIDEIGEKWHEVQKKVC